MLSKPTGPTGFYTLSSTTGTHTASTWLKAPNYGGTQTYLPANKVRIAVAGQPATINFGDAGIADNNSDILIPPGIVEHFKLESTSTISFILVGSGSNGYISITPVA